MKWTEGQVSAAVLEALSEQYGEGWRKQLAHHLDQGGGFYVALLMS